MSAGLDWICILAAWLLAAIAVVILFWALFWDRSRGRKRCPRCWYDMSAAVPQPAAGGAAGARTCPECGKSVSDDRILHRTRRRWGWAAIATTLLLAAYPLAFFPQALQRGWMYLLPDRLVIEALPLGGMGGPFGQEFNRRLGRWPWRNNQIQATFTQQDHIAILRRAAAGNIFARPVDQAWRDSYGRVLEGYQSAFFFLSNEGVLNPDNTPAPPELAAAVEALSQIPYILTVRTRDRWPNGIAPHFEFKVEHWWPYATRDEVSVQWVTSRGGASEKSLAGRAAFALPINEAGDVTVDLTVDVRQRGITRGSNREVRTVGQEKRTVSYTTVDSIDDVMAPVSSEAIDAALRAGITMAYKDSMFDLDTQHLSLIDCDDVFFGVSLELQHDGKPVMTAEASWPGANPRMRTYGNVGIAGEVSRSGGLRRYILENAAKPGWTLRLRSDPAEALTSLSAKHYWKGDMTFPIQLGIPAPQNPVAPAAAQPPAKESP